MRIYRAAFQSDAGSQTSSVTILETEITYCIVIVLQF